MRFFDRNPLTHNLQSAGSTLMAVPETQEDGPAQVDVLVCVLA